MLLSAHLKMKPRPGIISSVIYLRRTQACTPIPEIMVRHSNWKYIFMANN